MLDWVWDGWNKLDWIWDGCNMGSIGTWFGWNMMNWMEYDGLNGIWVELGNDWIGYGGLGVIYGLDWIWVRYRYRLVYGICVEIQKNYRRKRDIR